tara:strand:- start:439 stop:660 length:222 start_codon:yes stop_codon:yes gene_type:complete
MKLSDQVIAEISRLLQVALLTGTDVVDNLRLIEVEIDEDYTNNVVLTDAYVKKAETNIEKMVAEAENLGSTSE